MERDLLSLTWEHKTLDIYWNTHFWSITDDFVGNAWSPLLGQTFKCDFTHMPLEGSRNHDYRTIPLICKWNNLLFQLFYNNLSVFLTTTKNIRNPSLCTLSNLILYIHMRNSWGFLNVLPLPLDLACLSSRKERGVQILTFNGKLIA